jgi:putative NADPH-quinone reductase
MRFLVIYAHPVKDSFVSALHQRAVAALKGAGHEVDDCDLYTEGFQPVLSREERIAYHNVGANQGHVAKEIERLRRCDGLVLVFPTWWYGMPAILKGYIDRVWLPGVVFKLDRGRTQPILDNVERFAVVTTYGSPWWLNKLIFDPNRSMLMRGIRLLFPRVPRALWLALYGMDSADAAKRAKFLRKVERRLREL